MGEMAKALKLRNGGLGLHVIQFPTGKFGYVGSVPADIYYVEGASQDDIQKAAQFGERFGPKRRIFDTYADAVSLAQSRGYTVIETKQDK